MNIPLPPEFTEQQLRDCRKNNDFSPIMFEWFKYTGLLANFYASIQLESPAVRDISKIHYSVLIGLLNRCSRLILSNVALSHEGLFGETTSIIDRSIFESSVKLTWLCDQGVPENFNRFIADGLKTELELKEKIQKNIELRNGQILPIEQRMLKSINNYFSKSGLSEDEIQSSKKIPNLAQMIESIGQDRLAYIVGQKIGSHHVHGTWVSLWFHYVEEKDDVIFPRDHNCKTHINQYVYVSLSVLYAIVSYVHYIFPDKSDAEALAEIPEVTGDEIYDLYINEVVGSDFGDEKI